MFDADAPEEPWWLDAPSWHDVAEADAEVDREAVSVAVADAAGSSPPGPERGTGAWSPAADRLAAALTCGPGAEAGVLLADLDPLALRADDKVRLAQAWEAQAAHAWARQAAALAALDERHPLDGPDVVLDPEYTDVEVRAALRLSPTAAASRLDLARALAGRLAPTAAALSAGAISWAHVRVLHEGLAGLPDAEAAAVQPEVLEAAATRTPAATRRVLARAVLAVDPAAAERRHQRARTERSVRVWSLPDGMAALHVEAPAEQVQQAWTVLTEAALGPGRRGGPGCDPAAGDARGLDTRRADLALERLVTLPAAGGAESERRRPRVLVTVALSTLVGADDLPARLDGHGWITAEAARRIAADATLQRLLLDPVTGRPVDLGTTVYRPPRHLAALVTLRDVSCRAPHCDMPAWRCDLDHVRAAGRGGPTSAGNLQAECRHDHRAKTHGGWACRQRPDGATEWRSPRGLEYRVPPHEHSPGAARALGPPG